jgi:hypothetical protein
VGNKEIVGNGNFGYAFQPNGIPIPIGLGCSTTYENYPKEQVKSGSLHDECFEWKIPIVIGAMWKNRICRKLVWAFLRYCDNYRQSTCDGMRTDVGRLDTRPTVRSIY